MIQIDYDFPKNDLQIKCWCNENEDMQHIYQCELLSDNNNEKVIPYNKIYNGNLKEQKKYTRSLKKKWIKENKSKVNLPVIP